MDTASPRPFVIRRARREDSAALVRIVDIASEGLSTHICKLIAPPGEGAKDVAEAIASADGGSLSWRNGWIVEMDGAVAGGMISFRLGPLPVEPDGLLPKLVPLWALERRAQGLHYVYAIATFREFRGNGLARALMRDAERQAEDAPGICLIVADRNVAARQLYASLGYVDEASMPIVTNGWQSDSENWILMRKALV